MTKVRMEVFFEVKMLTHICLAAFLWDIGKQSRPRSDAAELGSDQSIHCLLTECSVKNWNKNEKFNPTTLKTDMDWSN